MAKRPRYSRWRRLPPVFRSGENKGPKAGDEEQRISLYVAGSLYDLAESQANRLEAGTVQEYCTELVRRAIEAEHAREQVAELEARRGALEGLRAIADDPEYLAELSGKTAPREPTEPWAIGEGTADGDASAPAVGMPQVDIQISPAALRGAGPLEPFEDAVYRHAGLAGDDPMGFLAILRRGESVSLAGVNDLAQALQGLEDGLRNGRAIDRRLAYALHRLAFEGQVLHTDAWPGAFDDWTVETLRAVQEYVDRILSGQDIRYYPAEPASEDTT